MADPKMFMIGILLALAGLSAVAEVVAAGDASFGNTTTTAAINTTSSALPLLCAGDATPSISSTRHDLDADGGGPSSTLCLHRASTQAYDGVVPLKDGSGRPVTTAPLRTSASATSPCRGGAGITSFGQDADKNALLLATNGVYQVVGPSLCHAATHTKTPMSIKRLLEWVFGVIGTLGGGYVVYKKCSCFNRNNDINVNAPNGNVNIFNGNNGIQLAVSN